MAAVRSFEELEVWRKSLALAEAVYKASRAWPPEERYGLTQQLRRAAASVPANIAEGAERKTPREFARFLAIARGSLGEAKTFVILAERLEFLSQVDAARLKNDADEIGRMIAGLVKSIEVR